MFQDKRALSHIEHDHEHAITRLSFVTVWKRGEQTSVGDPRRVETNCRAMVVVGVAGGVGVNDG